MMNRRQALMGLTGLAAIAATPAFAQGKPMRIATDSTFPPFESLKDGKPVGFDIDLMDAIAAEMGRKVEWTSIDFKGLIPGILAGRFDMAVSAIYITPERQKVVDFTDPYYAGGLVVIKRANETGITDVASLDGKTVSVQQGTKSVSFLAKTYPKIHTDVVETNEEMFDMLRTKRVDAVVTGRPAALLFVKQNPDMALLATPLTKEEYGMAVSKKEPELTKQVNAALVALRKNGTYKTLVTKWFGAAG